MLLLNRTLLKMAKGLWGWIIALVALKLMTLAASAYFAVAIADFLGLMLTLNATAEGMKNAILSALGVSILILGIELLIGEVEYRCTAAARVKLRNSIFNQVLALDGGHVETLGPVSAITTSSEGVESMQLYFSKYLPGLIYCLFAPVYLFFRLQRISLAAAIVLFAMSIVLLPFNNIFRKKIEGLKTEYWDSLEDLTGTYLESLQGLSTLKLLNQDERRTEILKGKAENFNQRIMAVMKVNFASFLFTDGMIYLAMFLAVAIAAMELSAEGLEMDKALVVLMLSYSYFGSVRQLMNITHSALSSVSAAEKVDALMAFKPSHPVDPDKKKTHDFDGIEMRNVSFGYPQRKTVLKNITLSFPRSKTTALVGLSGCGKSTLAQLLLRFQEPEDGEIFLDGQDIRGMSTEELRQKIIMVPQTVSIFSGTIRDNLRIANPLADETMMQEALKAVHLEDWINTLKEGLDSDVGDAGAKLSGGQRQKIGIARALLKEAPIIIFDEATSSVDPLSEKEIWKCIEELSLSRTLIIISHRLSTIRKADNIVVLKEGEIIESGSHARLLENGGLYASLSAEQRKLEEEGRIDE